MQRMLVCIQGNSLPAAESAHPHRHIYTAKKVHAGQGFDTIMLRSSNESCHTQATPSLLNRCLPRPTQVQVIEFYMASPVAVQQLLWLHPNSLAAPRHRRCRSQQGLPQLIRPALRTQHHTPHNRDMRPESERAEQP